MFEIIIFFVTIIAVGYFMSNKEQFQTSSSASVTNSAMTSAVATSATATNETTSSTNLNDMEVIDFSILDTLKKKERDENSIKLQDCLSKFSNNPRPVLRDPSELMFKKGNYMDDITNNIYSKTEVGVGVPLNQLTFW